MNITKIFGILFLIDFLVIGFFTLLGANKKTNLAKAVKCEKIIAICCVLIMVETAIFVVCINK